MLFTKAGLPITTSFQRAFDHTYRQYIGISSLWFSQITPSIFLGGQYSKRGLRLLKLLGFTAIVSIRTKLKPAHFKEDGIEYLHLQVADRTAPSIVQLLRASLFIRKQLKLSGKIYIHCAVGEGRSPTVLAAYFILNGKTLASALGIVRQGRPFIRPTETQLYRLAQFEKLLQKR